MQNVLLKLGDALENVKILQEKLKILGLYNPVITGKFDLSTQLGVITFQEENNLDVTGIVDEDTWNLLFELTKKDVTNTYINYPKLQLGSSGMYVNNLQRKLKALLYYTEDINSFFGIETYIAVKRFQFHNDLTTTGVVDDETWSEIDRLYDNLGECAIENIDDDYIIYIVNKGDTLYSIANKYGVTVDSIKQTNNLTNNILSIGQTLKIPSKTNNNIMYTVKKGDTLYSIANKYGVTVDYIKQANNLTNNTLSIGQILTIPSTNIPNTTTYTVKKGDTLYSIANKYNVTVDSIKQANNLINNTLSIGQILIIPSTNISNTITYTVKKGDTLYSIANKYGVTVDYIKQTNNLTNNTLSIGQILNISL